MHNITEIDKQEGIEQASHRLTVIRPDFGLDNNWLGDWDIEPCQVYIKENGSLTELPFRQLVCNDGPIVGAPYNPETYRPISNSEFIGLVKDCVGGTAHELISAGSIRSRGRTFLSFKINGLGEYDAAGRAFRPYLNFGNGHDRSSVFWVNTGGTCTVCDNTFSMNLYQVERRKLDSEAGDSDVSARLRHTINVIAKFPDIVSLVDKAVGVHQEFAKALNEMVEKKVNTELAKLTFTGFMVPHDAEKISTRSQNNVDMLVDLFQSGRGNSGENRADMFSAVTDYYTNRNGKDGARRFASSEFGFGAQRKREFFGLMKNEEALVETQLRGSKLMSVT